MFCIHCGAQISDNAAFCENCGAAVSATSEESVQSVEQPVCAQPNNTADTQQPVSASVVTVEDPGKQMGLISMILGIIGLALGSICSCLFACLGGFLPLAAAIVGVVLGVKAKAKSAEAGFANKQAQVGVILSIVAIALIVIFVIANAIIGGVVAFTGEFY